MTDTTTNELLTVDGLGGEYSSLTLPISMVDKVRPLLDAHGIRYWVDENEYTVNDDPPFTVITFHRGTDTFRVQELLDSAP